MRACLVTSRGRRPLAALATDLDRTLTDPGLHVVPSVISQLRRVHGTGVFTVLVSGRRARELLPLPRLRACFDAFVLESGAVVGPWDALQTLGDGDAEFRRLGAWLERHAVPYDDGHAVVSFYRANVPLFDTYDRRHRFALHPNHDRVDVTRRGVSKGTGLRRLLSAHHRRGILLAFGDGENDRPMFRISDHAVAVANAHPSLLALADE